MDGRNLEPRMTLWAVAEISWEDSTGTPFHAPATLEDISVSGACIRVKTPVSVGSKVTVKWKREQFSAIARNCRSDGREFLLGVRRDPALLPAGPKELTTPPKPKLGLAGASPVPPASADVQNLLGGKGREKKAAAETGSTVTDAGPGALSPRREPFTLPRARGNDSPKFPPRRTTDSASPQFASAGASSRRERKSMQSKGFFPRFWRQRDHTEAPQKIASTEAPMNKSQSSPADGLTGPHTDLLSYEDIYHAAGILSPRSGYGIHKVVDMLNSDRIRNLSPDIKRASVLMALDAAGASAEDLLQDATRRQQALASYEAGQQKQLQEFEARKEHEIAQIQAEMERVTAHYSERIQHSHDQVAQEKEALRNWQVQKQFEAQRIAEVIDLCSKQAVASPASTAAAAASATTAVRSN